MPLMKTFALAGTQIDKSPLFARVSICVEVGLAAGLGAGLAGAGVGVFFSGPGATVVPAGSQSLQVSDAVQIEPQQSHEQ